MIMMMMMMMNNKFLSRLETEFVINGLDHFFSPFQTENNDDDDYMIYLFFLFQKNQEHFCTFISVHYQIVFRILLLYQIVTIVQQLVVVVFVVVYSIHRLPNSLLLFIHSYSVVVQFMNIIIIIIKFCFGSCHHLCYSFFFFFFCFIFL